MTGASVDHLAMAGGGAAGTGPYHNRTGGEGTARAGTAADDVPDEDIRYLIDLGLLRMEPSGGLVVANPIYREVLPRALAFSPEASLPQLSPTSARPG